MIEPRNTGRIPPFRAPPYPRSDTGITRAPLVRRSRLSDRCCRCGHHDLARKPGSLDIAARLLDADGERLFLVEAGNQDGQGQVVDGSHNHHRGTNRLILWSGHQRRHPLRHSPIGPGPPLGRGRAAFCNLRSIHAPKRSRSLQATVDVPLHNCSPSREPRAKSTGPGRPKQRSASPLRRPWPATWHTVRVAERHQD